MSAQKRSIRLIVSSHTVVNGVSVPPGSYRGVEKKLIIPIMGRKTLLDPEYELELTANDVKEIPGWENSLGATLDATEAVRTGAIKVG
ncbi:hypothetical protein U8C36_12220 [Sinorhizobium medicae]|uniref:hypothetical protein n=1 Tax=Sinorhizobium medicae TaxID=110321 RepID=UPI002AF6A985|nr:hypothetical protein [Sinorhizobium medicae]WQO50727.1 hypothetical protein U8C36_12220 [Sinorhizobium medicae]